MLTAAVVLFLLAAVGGLVMAVGVFRGAKPPVALAVGHGLLAATALVLVLWIFLTSEAPAAVGIGLGILVLAALGGFYLLSFHLRDKPHPKAVVIVHAVVAVIGVGALVAAML